MKAVLAICLVAVSGLAGAQTQTDCTRDYFGNLHCQSQQQPQINWGLLNTPPVDAGKSFQEGFERGQRMRAEAERQRADREQRTAAERQQMAATEQVRAPAAVDADQARVMAEGIELARTQSAEVGKLIAAGDCGGAERFALEAGNFILAKQVKDYCAR